MLSKLYALMKKATSKNKEKCRCGWCGTDPFYIKYHDEEWGKPVHDDKVLFEFMVLESFQAGLSWLTILRKRENFRKAFANFDVKKVAKFDEQKYEALMQDTGIVRNQLKIRAAINNAKCFMEIQKEFGSYDNYIWSFVDHKPIVNKPKTLKDLPAKTPLSDAMSKDMGKRGFKFRGYNIWYDFMKVVGMVDDDLVDCWKKSR